VSRTELAQLLSTSPDMISKYIAEGLPVLVTGNGRGRRTMLDLADVLPWILARKTGSAEEARTRKDNEMADKLALANKVTRGELVKVEVVAAQFVECATAVKARLRRIPDSIADRVVKALLNRLIDHGVTHLNLLVIAGYDEAQRHELETYLDALDARKAALAQPEGFEPLPEVVVPAFLAPEAAPAITDQQVTDALTAASVAMKKKHIRLMDASRRAEVVAWSAAVVAVHARLGEAVTFDDLPPAPAFVINPSELEPSAETDETGEAPDTDGTSQAVDLATERKPARAPRRSSATFKNSPKMAGKVSKATGRKSRAVR